MLSVNVWSIIWTIVNLLVLYLIFKKFLLDKVMGIIKAREDMVTEQFDNAEKSQEEAQQLKIEYQGKLSDAEAEADRIVLEARARAEEEHNHRLETTRAEADRMLVKAKADIANEQAKASQAAQSEIARLAVLAARKIMETGEIHDAGSSK